MIRLRLMFHSTKVISFSFIVVTATVCAVFAQEDNVNASNVSPIPGVGHDYIKALSETVDPASGMPSVRLAVPTPPGRGLTLPFSFAYDANGVWFGKNGYTYPAANTAVWSLLGESPNVRIADQSGWSYTMPKESYSGGTWLGHSRTGAPVYCHYYNWFFTDSDGVKRVLGLFTDGGPSYPCSNPNETLLGGDIAFEDAR